MEADLGRRVSGFPVLVKTLSTNGSTTVLRNGTASTSVAIWFRCSIDLMPPPTPPL